MTFNTGNPIGSTDARDLSDNAENFDHLENSTTKLTHSDRLGTVRKTRHGMEVEHDAQIAAHETEHDAQMRSFENDFDGHLVGMAFTRVGSFTTGATLTDMRQTLEYSGHEYSWAGTFPKVVAAGSTPAASGGIGAGAWVDRTDLTLRSELAAVTGASLVNTSTGETVEYRLSSIDVSLSSIEVSLSGKADLAGSASQTFSVADATDPHHAVSYDQYLTTPTDTVAGIVRRATDVEEVAGKSDVGFLTPLGLRNALNAGGNTPVYACRSWVNFDGTGTIRIRGSGNVSSLTDNGKGDYTVNFTTAMPDANYSMASTAGGTADGPGTKFWVNQSNNTDTYAPTTTSTRIGVGYADTIYADCGRISVQIFR